MADNEKFVGFKQALINENEEKYGAEIRTKYGDVAVDASHARIKGLTQWQYDEGERLRVAYEEKLKTALETGDPLSEGGARGLRFAQAMAIGVLPRLQ